jgi:hypothetical protein
MKSHFFLFLQEEEQFIKTQLADMKEQVNNPKTSKVVILSPFNFTHCKYLYFLGLIFGGPLYGKTNLPYPLYPFFSPVAISHFQHIVPSQCNIFNVY